MKSSKINIIFVLISTLIYSFDYLDSLASLVLIAYFDVAFSKEHIYETGYLVSVALSLHLRRIVSVVAVVYYNGLVYLSVSQKHLFESAFLKNERAA